MASKKTVIVTGASQGIGAAVVQAFLGRDYNVVATSRSVSRAGFAPSPSLALVDGDIGQAATGQTSRTPRPSRWARKRSGLAKRAYGWPEQAKFLVPEEHFADGIGGTWGGSHANGRSFSIITAQSISTSPVRST
jgi:NAD(P)-dependent dehydrogenase (short-subunit alcohol dehydrogenase family)